MFRNILIGVDGRQGGRDAIALARQLAASDAELTLAHVDSAPVGAVSGLDRDRSRRLLAQERQRSGAAQTATSFAWSVGRGLHELAERHGADLIVIGSTHRALLGRVLAGDNCISALDGAPCAVAVAPRGYAGMPQVWVYVGVGHDRSPESEQALVVARDIAGHHGARLKAFHVVSLPEVRDERPLPADWPNAIQELIERNTEELARLSGLDVAVRYGGPGEELVQFGGGVDLMVVGSRGYGPLGRLFHGSVSHYLVQHAKCPVLVLPRGTVDQAQAAAAGAESIATVPS